MPEMNEMTEAQLEEAERILSYCDALVEAGTFSERAREWALQDSLNLLRDLLPEWSAFKEEV